MSDRRAVSAGNLATASVANEPWRVAVGGNRVQNMTVEQIAHAFAAGQLTLRTPLWPPGTSGWQALGNFEQFQSSEFVQPQGYSQLSQFEEADDDPTRMWTGSGDLSELPGMEPMAPLPSAPPPAQQRPSARTGPRQVSTRAPAARSLPAPAPAARMVSAAAMSPATVSSAAVARSMRPQRSSGLWLVAGLVGLVGLGSAVLAARGSWSVAAPPESTVSAATPAPEPARAVTPPSTVTEPSQAAPSTAELAQADAPKVADPAATPPANAEATGTPAAEVNQARLAKYEDTQASAFVAEAQPATKKRLTESKSATRESAKAKSLEAKAKAAETKREEEAASAAKEAEKEKESSKVSSTAAKHAAVAAAPAPKAKPHPATEAKTEAKADVKAEPAAVSSAVNDAAAAALGNSAKLASSCRPPGGATGPGKARVIYSNDGEVQSVEILTAKFRDTLTGSCVKMVFRRAKIPPFKGEPPTFIKSFTIPEE
jgi:hypothetical protein